MTALSIPYVKKIICMTVRSTLALIKWPHTPNFTRLGPSVSTKLQLSKNEHSFVLLHYDEDHNYQAVDSDTNDTVKITISQDDGSNTKPIADIPGKFKSPVDDTYTYSVLAGKQNRS